MIAYHLNRNLGLIGMNIKWVLTERKFQFFVIRSPFTITSGSVNKQTKKEQKTNVSILPLKNPLIQKLGNEERVMQ